MTGECLKAFREALLENLSSEYDIDATHEDAVQSAKDFTVYSDKLGAATLRIGKSPVLKASAARLFNTRSN